MPKPVVYHSKVKDDLLALNLDREKRLELIKKIHLFPFVDKVTKDPQYDKIEGYVIFYKVLENEIKVLYLTTYKKALADAKKDN